MSTRSCRVTVTDLEGVEHTTTVAAGSLYEAVARGLVALRRQEWIAGVALEHGAVTVEVGEAPVEHNVKLAEFNKWVRKDGGSPRDVVQRGRVREILGMGTGDHTPAGRH
ncbi:MAG TPA: hypothetical protein VEJ46_13990 [Candidatus Acidoferrum sp.]|nr:hypothetical protein [Candidatus Acidoferrum sp.]